MPVDAAFNRTAHTLIKTRIERQNWRKKTCSFGSALSIGSTLDRLKQVLSRPGEKAGIHAYIFDGRLAINWQRYAQAILRRVGHFGNE